MILFPGRSYSDDGICSVVEIAVEETQKPILECHKNCKCNDNRCRNRRVGKPSTHNLTVFKTENRGYGLKSDSRICRGEFVSEYLGEYITKEEACHRSANGSTKNTYIISVNEYYINSKSQCFIDARRYGNNARFINHSCDPNLLGLIVRVGVNYPRLALFACRDIEAGEELTFSYGSCHSDLSSRPCFCGSTKCLGFLPHDKY